jgi:small subunit ribosomal protein S4
VVVRAGFAPTRSAARQMVSHGHIIVNGKKVTIPSYEVQTGDMIAIREGSKKKALFAKLDEELKNTKAPAWLTVDGEKREVKVAGVPDADMNDLLFDVRSVLEFYTR